MTQERQMTSLEPTLTILRCPIDHGSLLVVPEGLVNTRLQILYPLVEGVPDLRVPATPNREG